MDTGSKQCNARHAAKPAEKQPVDRRQAGSLTPKASCPVALLSQIDDKPVPNSARTEACWRQWLLGPDGYPTRGLPGVVEGSLLEAGAVCLRFVPGARVAGVGAPVLSDNPIISF